MTDRRRYVTPGTHIDLITHGRKCLLPFFAGPLSDIDGERSREGLATMVELVDDGELSPKTVNNARTYLSVALSEAVRSHDWYRGSRLGGSRHAMARRGGGSGRRPDLSPGCASFSVGIRVTKGKRFRSAQVRPRLGQTLRSAQLARLAHEMPDEGRLAAAANAGRTTPVPPHARLA